MPEVQKDVLSVYDEIIAQVLGISDQTEPPRGRVASLLPQARPVNSDDFLNPWTPDLTGAGAGTAAAPTPADLERITKRQRNLVNLSRLVDKKIGLDSGSAGSTISDTWRAIVEAATAQPIPAIESELLKKQLDDATKLLMKPDPEDPEGVIMTSSYERYRTYAAAYDRAIREYTAQYMAAMTTFAGANTWPVVGRTYQSAVESALNDWETLGKKEKIEDAIALLGAQGSDAATGLIHTAKKRFDRWQVAAGMVADTVPYVEVSPSNWCDPKAANAGWTTFTYSSTDSRSIATEKVKKYSGKAGFTAAVWSVGASASHGDAQTHEEVSLDELAISFSYALVNIERPWLSTTLLNLSNWFLRGAKRDAVSTGSTDQTQPTQQESLWMPLLPTQMIVIKDLEIRVADATKLHDTLKKVTDAGGSVGIMGFGASGSYHTETGMVKQSYTKTDRGIKVDGIQIIGWVSDVMPRSPRLDSPA